MIQPSERSARHDQDATTELEPDPGGPAADRVDRTPADGAGVRDDMPLDPDVDRAVDEPHRHRPGATGPFAPAGAARGRPPWARPRILVAIALGGLAGGIARYRIGLAYPAAGDAFPWATFGINTGGAFALALLVVLVTDVAPPSTYLRPAIGTGLLGAFTTFSSVVVTVDHLAARGHTATAVGYLAASAIAGLAAAALGLVLGRAIAANRHRVRHQEG